MQIIESHKNQKVSPLNDELTPLNAGGRSPSENEPIEDFVVKGLSPGVSRLTANKSNLSVKKLAKSPSQQTNEEDMGKYSNLKPKINDKSIILEGHAIVDSPQISKLKKNTRYESSQKKVKISVSPKKLGVNTSVTLLNEASKTEI